MESITVGLTSQNALKKEALEQSLKSVYQSVTICSVDSMAPTAEQPINTGYECAMIRIEWALKNTQLGLCDFIVSIENGFDTESDEPADICYAVLRTKEGNIYTGQSTPIFLSGSNRIFFDLAKTQSDLNYKQKHLGWSKTVGTVIEEETGIDSKNWMADKRFGGKNRSIQIQEALSACIQNYIENTTK